jgi:hypothetical protein
MESKVAAEVAEQEFARFLEAMDLQEKFDAKEMDPEDVKAIAETKRIVISAMQRGNLVIDADGQPVFTPMTISSAQFGEITFHEPTGADLMAMDGVKQNRDVERTNRLLAALTNQSPAIFAKMKNRDLKVCQAIVTLFLS